MKRHLELAPANGVHPDTSPKNWRDFLKIPEFFLPVPDLGAYPTSGPGPQEGPTFTFRSGAAKSSFMKKCEACAERRATHLFVLVVHLRAVMEAFASFMRDIGESPTETGQHTNGA
jgi:hypothetical protein